MGALFISLLTLVLVLISAFVVLIVLMQRTSQSGGMGAALGGGAAESAFGADTNNVLTNGTIYGIIAFFVTALVLYLVYQSQAGDLLEANDATLLVAPEEVPAPVAETTTAITEAVEGPVEMTTAEDLIGTIQATAESVQEQAEDVVEAAAEAAPAVEVEAPAVETVPATN